jgi:hypothetical protein
MPLVPLRGQASRLVEAAARIGRQWSLAPALPDESERRGRARRASSH